MARDLRSIWTGFLSSLPAPFDPGSMGGPPTGAIESSLEPTPGRPVVKRSHRVERVRSTYNDIGRISGRREDLERGVKGLTYISL
jgi:hypothetical protein